MNSIFSAERVNIGRQLEFDLVKAVTIVLMIWTHTYEALSTGFEPSLSAINSYVRGSIALKERTEAFFGRHRVFWTVFV